MEGDKLQRLELPSTKIAIDSESERSGRSKSKSPRQGKRHSSNQPSFTRSRSGSPRFEDDEGQGSREHSKEPAQQQKAVFVDADAMRAKIRAEATKPTYDVSQYYWEHGVYPYIAKHPVFEKMTLFVIAFNALWIAIDTDGNDAATLIDAQPVYQIAEHFFCVYFCFEWWVRFSSFKKKYNGLKDGWFVFDSCLVLMMFLETWVMTAVMLLMGGAGGAGLGQASILRMARLLRLSRMARMARLFRAVPELLILIKGIAAATRSVFFTLCLLAIILYVFGIAFRQLTAGTKVGERFFKTVPMSMHTLLIDGTILDGTGTVVMELGNESLILGALFYFLVLLAAFTVMNMLIGVLCEVVGAVAATERETIAVTFVKMQLQKVMDEVNEDGDDRISKEEFANIIKSEKACAALQEVGIDVPGLIENIDMIFEKDPYDDDAEEKSLRFEDFMNVILRLRGDNYATVKDIVDLRKMISNLNQNLLKRSGTENNSPASFSRSVSPGALSRSVSPGRAELPPVSELSSSDRVSNTLTNNGFGGQVVANDSVQKHTNNYANSIHIQQTLVTMGPTASQGSMPVGPMGPAASQGVVPSGVEEANTWMYRARLVESLLRAQMELSRFVESLPPTELCVPSPDAVSLPGQANDGVGPAAGGTLSSACTRWSQSEMQWLKGQMGKTQEAVASSLANLQRERVRDLCHPQLQPGRASRGSNPEGGTGPGS